MNQKTMFVSACFFAAIRCASAVAIIDTGDSSSVGCYILNDHQWLAGKVHFGDNVTISEIDTVLDTRAYWAQGGAVTVALYDLSGSGLPGGILDSSSFNLGNNYFGWTGASGLDWDVLAGDYWVSFQVGSTSAAKASVSDMATSPLPDYAFNTGAWHSYNAIDMPLKLIGEASAPQALDFDSPQSVPDGGSSLALLGFGFAGLVCMGRHFRK